MKIPLILQTFLVLVLFSGLHNCFAEKNIPEKCSPEHGVRVPQISTGKHIQIEKLFSLGKAEDIPENENYLFGLVFALKTDRRNQLYVLEHQPAVIVKYDPEGMFLQKRSLNKGNGPGEFIMPVDFAVDAEERLYIVDQALMRLSVLDKSGTFLRSWQLKLKPARIALRSEEILISHFEMGYEGAPIQVYSRKGLFLYAFGKSIPKGQVMLSIGHIFGSLTVDPAGKVSWICYYPYQINQFDASGKLLWQKNRDVKGVNKPFFKGKRVISRGGVKGVGKFAGGALAVVVNPENQSSQLDIWDDKGNFKMTIPADRFGLKQFRLMAIDQEDCIYFYISDPYPHINKYRIRGI